MNKGLVQANAKEGKNLLASFDAKQKDYMHINKVEEDLNGRH
jgi:hypothetical protein